VAMTFIIDDNKIILILKISSYVYENKDLFPVTYFIDK
jgi:hypothetical protein